MTNKFFKEHLIYTTPLLKVVKTFFHSERYFLESQHLELKFIA